MCARVLQPLARAARSLTTQRTLDRRSFIDDSGMRGRLYLGCGSDAEKQLMQRACFLDQGGMMCVYMR